MIRDIFLFVATGLAYFVKGITGFGNTLVMGSLFSFVIPNRLITPTDLLMSIPTNGFMVWKNRKQLSPRIILTLSGLLLLGAVPGALLLKTGNDRLLKAGLGLVVIGIAVEMLTRKTTVSGTLKKNPAFLGLIGFLSGVLAGLYGIGALLVAYIDRTASDRNQFRANLCCVFLVDNVFRFFWYYFTGLLTLKVFLFSLFLSPAVVAGMFIGLKADARLSELAVKKATVYLLIFSGVVLFVKNIFF